MPGVVFLTAGRGPDRVGVATAGSLADVPWEVAERRMRRLGEAVRLAVASPDERAEFVGLLVSDVTISADDRLTVTGNLGCTEKWFGSPTWIRTTNTGDRQQLLGLRRGPQRLPFRS